MEEVIVYFQRFAGDFSEKTRYGSLKLLRQSPSGSFLAGNLTGGKEGYKH